MIINPGNNISLDELKQVFPFITDKENTQKNAKKHLKTYKA